MRIAVIGAGISGMLAARLLASQHDVELFESEPRLGGHTRTVRVHLPGAQGGEWPVDTGFIVFNPHNYPILTRLFELLGVASRESTMSFALRDDTADLEWKGSNHPTDLFAQRRNLLRPRFWRMLREIPRFNRLAGALARDEWGASTTLDDWLQAQGFGEPLREHYILPMCGAIWSLPTAKVRQLPLRFVARFLDNHRMLSLGGRPIWRTVAGGSDRYIEPLLRPLAAAKRIHCSKPARRLERHADGVTVHFDDGCWRGDRVVLALHAPQALALLAEPSAHEREVLSTFAYQPNPSITHTDIRLLPRRRRAWAAWNQHRSQDPEAPISVTYHMNQLQGLDAPEQLLVSLNPHQAPDAARILDRNTFEHPVMTVATAAAQARRGCISGADRVHYCGAYWGWGFHEDGAHSAVQVAAEFGISPWTRAFA
jgi:hypothetical protein